MPIIPRSKVKPQSPLSVSISNDPGEVPGKSLSDEKKVEGLHPEHGVEKNSPPAEVAPVATWSDLGLAPEILKLVEGAGYTAPTPIQAQSIPVALRGEDLIASAQTGSGKTASFVLPLVEKLKGKEGTLAVILSPTREIAQQTNAVIELFGKPMGLRTAVLIGGVNMRLDDQVLQTYPQIIVATPGRLCDHLDRGNLWLDYIQMVVLDEADRMLDMGFSQQLNRIMEEMPNSRQTLVYSATFPPLVEKLAHRILHNPTRITVGRPTASAPSIDQFVQFVKEEEKVRALMRVFREEKGSIIVFTRTKDTATRLWRSLHSRSIYDVTFIHSDRLQAHREQALAEFKEGKFRVLIATDVAARGIHVDDVALVVNYDLPLEPEDYIHRIGRTGRQGASGKAISFVTSKDRRLLDEIERLLKKKIPSI